MTDFEHPQDLTGDDGTQLTEFADGGVPCRAAVGHADSPELVIRGETNTPENPCPASNPDIAHPDWCALTLPAGSYPTRRSEGKVKLNTDWLRSELQRVFCFPPEAWCVTSRGWHNYEHRIDLGRFGLVAYGGEHQRGTVHISVNGEGCAVVKDWHNVRAWGESLEATITRLDLAHDDFEGKTVNMDIALGWREAGGFSANGRPPKFLLMDDFGSGDGKTLAVGSRANGKFARLYEKGRQLGDPSSPWFRVEVEWHNKNRTVPWEALSNPGNYLAGAYPCLEFLSECQSKVRTTQKAAETTYGSMEKWCRVAAGKFLNVALYVHRGDPDSLLRCLQRDGAPKRLQPYEKILQNYPEDGPLHASLVPE